MMKALLVTFDKYPNGDAGAIRVHMFAKILNEAGYETFVISMGKSTNNRIIVEDDGINHISYRGNSDNAISKVMYYAKFPIKLYNYLKQNDIDIIIHTQVDVYSLYVIQDYGKRKKIPILYDSVEWYSESQFSNGKRARGYKQNDRYNMKYIQPPEAVIAISSYLEKHFIARNVQTIRIPVIMDVSSTCIKKDQAKDCVEVLYAGNPGKKDYLANFINGLSMLNEDERKKVRFTIAGCTIKQLIDLCGIDEYILELVHDSIRVLGRVSRSQVLEEYKSADFSVLIRPVKERYAQAGFPTKFVESMCCSTPVICNITSDLGKYAEDGVNSIILEDIEPEQIAQTLRRIICLSANEKKEMKRNARNTAIKMFDYHNFVPVFLRFIQTIKQ
ncbi:MAG: glycosyltransferase [Lachnospiraceae bacterium]